WRKRLGSEAWAELIVWEKKNRFHPHQLRHTAATRWRAEFGAEATLVLLGDRTTRMVDIYGEKDRATSAKIMEKCGRENRLEQRDGGQIRLRLGRWRFTSGAAA